MGWSSCCGSPSSTTFRAAPETATTLASDTWPASSTNSVSTLPSMSSRAHSHGVPAATSTSTGSERTHHVGVVVCLPDGRVVVGLVLSRPSGSPAPARPPAPPATRLPITLWLFDVIPTFLPARTSSRIIRAPVYVLPDPGGPWIASVVPSS